MSCAGARRRCPSRDQARRLLASIKVVRKVALGDGAEAEEPWLVGLRDRALMAVMTYTFARLGTVVAMRVEDYYPGVRSAPPIICMSCSNGGKRSPPSDAPTGPPTSVGGGAFLSGPSNSRRPAIAGRRCRIAAGSSPAGRGHF
jgi:hypothetical protein